MMKSSHYALLGTPLLLASLAISNTALADTTVWSFNLPSTAKASQTPPYPLVATLTLTDTATGVQFTLDPNELSPGVADPASSFVKQIDYVYAGPALISSSFVHNAGAAIDSFSYETNQNVDSGYQANDQHIVVDFFDNAPKKGDPDERFSFNETSSWTILGTQVSDFTSSFATSGPKPSPIFGVISVAPYALTDVHPTPSNWVASVPEPSTYALMLSGLALVGFLRYRRNGIKDITRLFPRDFFNFSGQYRFA